MLYVAKESAGAPVLVRDVAVALDIPSSSVAKIVQNLTRQGLLKSHKGPGGGVTLGDSGEQATLLRVVEVSEGLDLTRGCVLGIPGCSDEGDHCPLHERWGAIREQLVSMLADATIAGLAGELDEQNYVLSRDDGGGK